MRELSEPAQSLTLPPASVQPFDPVRMMATAAEYGIEIRSPARPASPPELKPVTRSALGPRTRALRVHLWAGSGLRGLDDWRLSPAVPTRPLMQTGVQTNASQRDGTGHHLHRCRLVQMPFKTDAATPDRITRHPGQEPLNPKVEGSIPSRPMPRDPFPRKGSRFAVDLFETAICRRVNAGVNTASLEGPFFLSGPSRS